MGWAITDRIRTEEDVRRCHVLATELAATVPAPHFQARGTYTEVLRDGESRQVEGLVHIVNVPEVRLLIVNPGYHYAGFGSSLLYNVMESGLRKDNFEEYFFNIPEIHEKVIKEYEKMGAVRVDPFADRQKIVRLLKRL